MIVPVLMAIFAAVEVGTVGDVPREVEVKVKSELGDIFAELGRSAGEEQLSIILVAGAINIRCIASRREPARSAEINLSAGSVSFRPGLDELVSRLFPEYLKPRTGPAQAPLQPAAPIEPPPKIAPWVVLGVGAGLFAGAILLGAHGSGAVDDLRNEPMSPAEFRSTSDRASAEYWAANIMFVSSAVCGVISAALFFDE